MRHRATKTKWIGTSRRETSRDTTSISLPCTNGRFPRLCGRRSPLLAVLVSLITVKRAYEELERAGIIYRRQGLGTFVAEQGAARSREAKAEHTEALLRHAMREGREAGLRDEQIMETLRRLLRER